MKRSKWWRLFAYLPASFAIVYGVNVPVHPGWTNPIIPSLVPWTAAAFTALARTFMGLSLYPAWIILACITAVLVLGHIVPH